MPKKRKLNLAAKGNKIDQKSKTDFFLDLFLSRFWAFLGEGSSKTR
jgi:hypothetical protein